jgi:hypothetical protein
MKAIATLVVVATMLAQTLNLSPRDLLNVARPLTTTEIATVLSASRQALTSKTFRLPSAPGGRGPESLLPLRREVSKRGMLAYGFNFTYKSIDLRPPAGIDAPECIR